MPSLILRVKSLGVLRLCVDDLSINVHGVFVLEGWEPGEHFVHQDAQGPPIDWLSVALIQQDLWCYVLGRAADREGALGNYLRESEINHFEIAIVSDHDVLWLEVAIDDILPMQVLKDADYLRSVELGLLQVEVLHSSVVGEKVAPPQKLSEEVDVAVVLHEAIVVHLKMR